MKFRLIVLMTIVSCAFFQFSYAAWNVEVHYINSDEVVPCEDIKNNPNCEVTEDIDGYSRVSYSTYKCKKGYEWARELDPGTHISCQKAVSGKLSCSDSTKCSFYSIKVFEKKDLLTGETLNKVERKYPVCNNGFVKRSFVMENSGVAECVSDNSIIMLKKEKVTDENKKSQSTPSESKDEPSNSRKAGK